MCPVVLNACLPDLLGLQLDRFVVEENTLALVRFWFPPLPNLCRKFSHNLLVNALKKNAGGLRGARFHTLGDPQFNWMRESDFQVDELLAGICGLHCSCLGFNAGPITNTNKTQNTDMTFRNAKDAVLQECSRSSWTFKAFIRPFVFPTSIRTK